MTARILSPSEIASRLPADVAGGRLEIGGRITRLDARSCTLSDAFESVDLQLAAPIDARVGDLAVFNGLPDPAGFRDAQLVHLQASPERSDKSEFDRVGDGLAQRLELRSRAVSQIRSYFADQGFLEVQTPSLVSAPGTDPHIEPLSLAQPGAETPAFLITSPEFHMKRLLVAGIPKIFQIAPSFRAEELGAWHDVQFTMLEWYRAFSDAQAVMLDTEEIVQRVVRALTGESHITLSDGRRIDVIPPFPRLTLREAYRRYAAIDDVVALAEADEAAYFQVYVDHVEPGLAALECPVFLTEFPASQAALARRSSEDPSVAERFELVVAGIELCNGFSELTDPNEQRRRFEQDCETRRLRGQQTLPIDERLLGALEAGMPPSGGNALGLDRLIALTLGQRNIASVQAFGAPWV